MHSVAPDGQQPRLEALPDEAVEEAARLLARAFLRNPIHMRVFRGRGPRALARNEIFFRFVVQHFHGQRLGAFLDGKLVGVAHWVWSWGRPSTLRKRLKAALQLAPVAGPSIIRVAIWSSAWTKHNVQGPQWRIGPIAVDPAARGRGIGPLLMQSFCDQVDLTGQAATLQTDRLDYVGFYESFGFQVTEIFKVLGVETCVMRRDPTPSVQASPREPIAPAPEDSTSPHDAAHGA